MALNLACPRCQRSLKADRHPNSPKNVECPQCGHAFQVTPAGITADLPRPKPAPVTTEERPAPEVAIARRPARWFEIGLISSVLLVGAAVVAAIFYTRTPPVEKGTPLEQVAAAPAEPDDIAAEPEKQRQEFIRFMIEGGVSLQAEKYAEALAAYQEATKLFPQDAEARRRFEEAQAAVARIAKEREAAQQRQAQVVQLVEQGQQASTEKKYAAAVEFFKLALQQDASNSAASTGLLAAQDALQREQLAQQKLTDYQSLIASGKAALKAGRYADAVRDFIAAERLVPDDPIARQLQREAETQLDGINNRAVKQKEFDRLLDLAKNALRSKNFQEAEKTYERALQLFPNDAAAKEGLTEAQKAGKAAQAEFTVWMFKGNAASQAGRFGEAALAFREATRVFPDNDAARRALRQAELAQDAQTSYFRAMERGASAMALKQYGDAIVAYNEALRVLPGDVTAAQGLLDAQRLFEAEAGPRRAFERHATIGVNHLKAQKYSSAVSELRAALDALPHHPQALIVERQLRYAEAMADGQQALAARRFADAVRHFQLALREYPNDFAARNGLLKAQKQTP